MILKMKLGLLKALLFLKNPLAFLRKQKAERQQKAMVAKLKKAVVERGRDQHKLQQEIVSYIAKARGRRPLTDHQALQLGGRKFGEELCEKGFSLTLRNGVFQVERGTRLKAVS